MSLDVQHISTHQKTLLLKNKLLDVDGTNMSYDEKLQRVGFAEDNPEIVHPEGHGSGDTNASNQHTTPMGQTIARIGNFWVEHQTFRINESKKLCGNETGEEHCKSLSCP
ncbi:hypothetical protein E2562_012520 [Oryza meyeriana var. granulata]|uniref:Uncharacterized protein n=1 Tax=Oryza meyeriana var. granulata TaxID=110450 RepID=A0A6G1BVM6_9ORYZ|nr:hypothetical protein E2562_012520 [Oryza meyeriana var. granulata]